MVKKVVTIHCSDTPNGKRIDIATIRKWHLERGFRDVGYHFVIQPSGELQLGRALNEPGAHVKGHNRIQPGNVINIGICLVGKDKFGLLQLQRLRDTIDGLRMSFDIEPWEIYCHYEFDQGKTCPNIRSVNLLCWYWMYDTLAIEQHIIKEKPHGI